MKTKKWIICIVTALLCLLVGALTLACNSRGGGSSDYKFEDYGYNNGTEENGEWRDLTYPDTDIKVDGVVNASEYGENYLSLTDVNGVNMKMYSHLGAEGVFFGFVSSDKNVYYDASEVYNNTSVEIQVAPAGTTQLNANVVQLRLGANGYSEQWIGMRAHAAGADGQHYAYTRKYIPSMGRVHIDGQLNSSDCKGYSMELYLPYTAINLSEKPEAVVCAPSFNTKPSKGPTRATWTMALGGMLDAPSTWSVVDDSGVTGRTGGFDDGKLESEHTVEQKGAANQFYYFDMLPQKAYYLQATVTKNDFLNNDNWPKFGLVNKSEGSLLSFHIDAANKNGTNFGKVRATHTTNAGTAWLWDTESCSSMANRWGAEVINGYENMKMAVLYLNGDLYMLLEDKLVYTEKGFSAESGAIPGFMTFNTAATYSDIEYTADETEVKAILADYAAKEVTIDGDLSDWEELENWNDVNGSKLTKKDPIFGQNEMTVWSFLGTDGLYVAYDVSHKTLNPVKKWDDGWWLNNNIELFVNGKQYALATCGSSGYMDAVMTTSAQDKENDCYYTKGEIFIPLCNFDDNGGAGADTTTVEAGFAFKAETGEAGDVLDGESWWFIDAEPNVQIHDVTVSGIGSDRVGEKPSAPSSEYTVDEDFSGLGKTLDGNDDDWEGAEWTTSGRSSWAATVEQDGLYFIIKLTQGHISNRRSFTDGDWWLNQNLEIQDSAGLNAAKIVYMNGKTSHTENVSKAAAKYTSVSSSTDDTLVFEFFIARDKFKDSEAKSLIMQMGGQLFENRGGRDGRWQVYLEQATVGAYKITYKYNNGSADTTQFVNKGEAVGTLPEPTRNGFTFDGWYNDGTKADETLVPTASTTLTAKWIPVEPTVSWSNGDQAATGTDPAVTPEWDAEKEVYTLTLPANPYTLADYDFSVWSVTVQGTEGATQHDAGDTLEIAAGSTVTISATWMSEGSVIRTVTFALGYEGAPQAGSLTVADGEKLAQLPADPVRKGHKFTGWYLSDGTTQFTTDTVVTKNMTVTAKWAEPITLDGNLDDWTGTHTLSVVGTDNCAGRSATFYGMLTEYGLYLAVDAYHNSFPHGVADWWQNVNFEFFINNSGNRDNQHFVYATGENTFGTSHQYMQIRTAVSGNATDGYHTVIEVFIPRDNVKDLIVNDDLRVGVAFKTVPDTINNGEGSGGGEDQYWVPALTWPDNGDKAHVTVNGIYDRNGAQ